MFGGALEVGGEKETRQQWRVGVCYVSLCCVGNKEFRMSLFSHLASRIRAKLDAWSSANENAAERYAAQRQQLDMARKEAIENEKVIARADQILLRAKLARLDKKIEASERNTKR